MSAMISMCPQWFMDESFVGRGNKNIKHMQSKYDLPIGTDATDRFLNSLSFVLKDKKGNSNEDADNADVISNEEAVSNKKTESFSENVTCKFVRYEDSD
eukprot:scaffold62041_cov56-Attheya_sp.AAC.1